MSDVFDEATWWARQAVHDASAAGRFVELTALDVWRLCAHLVDEQSADDLTQITYERALGALPRFRGDATARTWLLTIARRVCADEIRGRRRRRQLTTDLEALPERADPDETDHTSLVELVGDLDVDRREAFVLTQVLGLRYDEAAEILGCPIGTIRSRVARAREELQGWLDEPDNDDGAVPDPRRSVRAAPHRG